MARIIRRAFISIALAAIVAAAFFYGRDYVRRHPQNVPWTQLRLRDPVGRFTLRKLASLSQKPDECRALLSAAGSPDMPVPPSTAGPDCGYADGMRLAAPPGEPQFSPNGVVTSCPLAAALFVFERQVLQSAATQHLGSRVAVIEHAGSYSCRRLYGREEGAYSEHATANAIDITGFRLADGATVSVLRDWPDAGAKGAFLHEVRDGACRLFATTLSPNYNAAHADHFHFDQAERDGVGRGVCR